MYTSYTELDSRLVVSWRKQYGFLNVFYFNIFIACASFSIVMPSLWPYIDKHSDFNYFLAFVLFIFSLGEFLGALFFGHLHNKLRTKACLFIIMTIGLIGSILYSLADYFHDATFMMVLLGGRFLQGIWTGGQQAVEQTYVSETVSNADKIKVLSELGIANTLGYIMGPVFGFIVSFLRIQLPWGGHVDSYTSSGYLQSIFVIIMMIWTQISFKEKELETGEPIRRQMTQEIASPPDMRGVVFCIFTCVTVFNSFTVQETVTTPLVTDRDGDIAINMGWSIHIAYCLFTAFGVISIFTFFVLHKLDGIVDDRKLVLAGLVSGLVGWVLWFDFYDRVICIPAFLVGYALVSVSFAVGRNVIFALFSKIIGNQPAGAYMGWMLAMGAVSRMLSPFWCVQSLSISVKICAGSAALLMLIATIYLLSAWDHCLPHEESDDTSRIKLDFRFKAFSMGSPPPLNRRSRMFH